MTQEEKSLLLKDLCARLPYGVWLNVKGQDGPKFFDFDEKLWSLWIEDSRFSINDKGEGDYEGICKIKSYLRPMLSMTKEEKEEVKPLFSKFTDEFGKRVLVVRQNKMTLYQDWLNAHYFDYRGLIEKGLAIEAPEEMYV